jgi:hypothetical protein
LRRSGSDGEIFEYTVAERKSFLLRIDPGVLEALQRWANDDLRSLNGQIEFLLRKALADARRSHPGSMPEQSQERGEA